MKNTMFKSMNSTIKLLDIEPEIQLDIERMFLHFEQKASRFIPDNELAFINNSPLHVPLFLDETLADLLDKSLILARKVNYYVHPFLGNDMMANGYTLSFQEQYKPIIKEQNFSDDHAFISEPIQRLSKRWLIKEQNFSFDFGGFGKGYVVDQAKKFLQEKDVSRALINAGGDLNVIGTYDVGIEHPILKDKDMIKLSITDSALATSGKNYRKWKIDKDDYHHILNGRTGKPACNGVIQASVVAKTTMIAETAAKILCILPFEQAKTLLYKNFPQIAYFVYFENNQIAIGGDSSLYEKLEVAS